MRRAFAPDLIGLSNFVFVTRVQNLHEFFTAYVTYSCVRYILIIYIFLGQKLCEIPKS